LNKPQKALFSRFKVSRQPLPDGVREPATIMAYPRYTEATTVSKPSILTQTTQERLNGVFTAVDTAAGEDSVVGCRIDSGIGTRRV